MVNAPVFTLDLEDHLNAYAPDGRWVTNSHAILDWCARQRLKGTFFAVGRAAAAPALLRRIVDEGHELALHSWDHVHLTKDDPARFRPRLEAAKKQFEDIGGAKVEGFRAPQFSLTPHSQWALDELAELGFTYSSSIIPGRGAFHGFPGASLTPFRWPQGLVEFPVPVFRAGPLALPFLGGVYLRYFPLALVRALEARLPPDSVSWTYLHPYDIDADEGFVRLDDGTPLWANWLLMHNRRGFLSRLARLVGAGRADGRLRLRDHVARYSAA